MCSEKYFRPYLYSSTNILKLQPCCVKAILQMFRLKENITTACENLEGINTVMILKLYIVTFCYLDMLTEVQ